MLLQEMPNPARIKLKADIRSAGTREKAWCRKRMNIFKQLRREELEDQKPDRHDADGIGDRVA